MRREPNSDFAWFRLNEFPESSIGQQSSFARSFLQENRLEKNTTNSSYGREKNAIENVEFVEACCDLTNFEWLCISFGFCLFRWQNKTLIATSSPSSPLCVRCSHVSVSDFEWATIRRFQRLENKWSFFSSQFSTSQFEMAKNIDCFPVTQNEWKKPEKSVLCWSRIKKIISLLLSPIKCRNRDVPREKKEWRNGIRAVDESVPYFVSRIALKLRKERNYSCRTRNIGCDTQSTASRKNDKRKKSMQLFTMNAIHDALSREWKNTQQKKRKKKLMKTKRKVE